MGVLEAVTSELDALGVTGWRREVAISLAEKLDEEANASMARELRSLMAETGSSAVPVKKGSTGDDLARQRAARIAKATGS